MKVLLINGSPHEKGCTYTALNHMAKILEERDVKTEIFHIGGEAVRGCIACQECAETGKCVFDDCVNVALKKAKDADGFVFGTPVYFASPTGTMMAFMDRFFNAGNFRFKPAAIVASARRGGCSATLDVLSKYPACNQMPIVSGDYWPLIHGNTPEEVAYDEEGLFTMETVGRNMAWLLKCIEAGKLQGIEPEFVDKKVWTNFIR